MKKYSILILTIFILVLGLTQQSFSQPTDFVTRGIGGGGALFFPKFNPANDDEFYVSCDMSQLFHSTDFGRTYNQFHHSVLQVFNTSTYELTQNPNIVYCNFNDGNEGYPVKSIDGGLTWNQMTGYNIGTYGNIYKMVVNYKNPDQLIIGAYGDILISNNGGISFSLVKHTSNNGAGLILGGVFWEGTAIYIGTNEGLIVSNNSGLSFSVSNTTGIPLGQVIWQFVGANSAGGYKLACITASVGDVYNGVMPWDYYGFSKGVYTLDGPNTNWVSKSDGINFSNDFIMYIAMSENDPNTIYLGGNDNALGAPLVMKSSNAGVTWKKVFKTANNENIVTGWEGINGDKNWSWSETCFGISVSPKDPNKILFANYSNIQASSDGGDSWRQAYVSESNEHPAGASTPKKQAYKSIGLENTTSWQMLWIDSDTIMACFSDIGGIRSKDGGESWGFQYNGFSVNSLYRLARSSNGTVYGACSNIHDMYQSTRLADAQLDANDANGKIVFSKDNGANWSTLHAFGHPVFWLALDPNNPEKMYASVIHYGGVQGAQQGGIWTSSNLSAGAASTWGKLPNPPRTEGHPASIEVLNDGTVVCTFSGRRNSSGAFTKSSGVFVYDPNTNTWSDRSDLGMQYWTKDLIIDPNDPSQNTWYVGVFSGWGGAPNGLGGLYRTNNRGVNWVKLTGTQFDRVTSMTFDPNDPDQAYLTTETQGLWLSKNANESIPQWNLVESYNFRQPERVFFNPYNSDEMWVTSFGNGMKLGTSKPLVTLDKQESGEVLLYPNPIKTGMLSFTFHEINKKLVQIKVLNVNGQLVLSKDGSRSELDTTDLLAGTYVIEFIFEDQSAITKKIVKL